MLIQASTIVGLPVAAMDSQSKIGQVKSLVFNSENGELLGLVIKTGGIFGKDKVLSGQDILDFDKNGIVTKEEENLVEIDEIVRIKKILADKIPVINQNALTKSGKNLGKIYDLLLETETMMIVKFYLHDWMQDRILPAEKVVKIEKKGIIFSDDVIDEIPSGEIEEAMA